MAETDAQALLRWARIFEQAEHTIDEECPRCHTAARVTKVSSIVAQDTKRGAWAGRIDTRGGSSPTFEWWKFDEYRSSHTHGSVGGEFNAASDLARSLMPPPEPHFYPPLIFGRTRAREDFDSYHAIWAKTKTLWDRCYYCELHDLLFVNVAGLGF